LSGSDIVRPKCLAPLGGTALIELQLRALRWCGVEDVTVVVGFEADRVRSACGRDVRFIENTDFAATNSLYSLWLARRLLKDGFVVMNCDVLFHPAMLADLITARYENALLVSYPEVGAPPFSDEEMKVSVRRGRVVDIRKDLPAGRTDGENVGIVKFSAPGAARLVAVMDRIVASGHVRHWAPRGFREFAREEALYAVGTRGLPWTEIDTTDDYGFATRHVFPAIEHALQEVVPALRRGA
jgi:choline kinase